MKNRTTDAALLAESLARVEVLEEENDRLSESAQTLLLLRKVSDLLLSAETRQELVTTFLEYVAILRNLPWCGLFENVGPGLGCTSSFALDHEERQLEERAAVGPQVKQLPLCSLTVLSPTEALTYGIRLDFSPEIISTKILAYCFSLGEHMRGVLLFVVDQDPTERMEEELRFLQDVAQLMILRLERMESLLLLREMNRKLESRVAQRTLELRASEEQHRALFEQGAVGIVDCNRSGIITRSNRYFATLLGYSGPEELTGRSFLSISHPDDRTRGGTSLSALWNNKCAHIAEDKRYVAKDGSEVWGRVVVSLILDSSGKPSHSIAVITDIGDLRESEAKLAQMEKMNSLGELAGGIAHDFNNLLTPIQCLSELMISEEPSGPIQADLHTILAASQRASALTHKILSFSRQQVLQRGEVRLPEVVDELVGVLRRTIRSDLELLVSSDSCEALIEGDVVQLEQVLVNLVVNAQNSIVGAGQIQICMDDIRASDVPVHRAKEVSQGLYLRLRVIDSGQGIAAENIDKIFEPFFTTRKKERGTGLGLSTVHGVVLKHKGHIWVDSEVGRGTCFTLLFPVFIGQNKSRAREYAPAEGPRGDERIAVVDDNDLVRGVAGRILSKHGYCVDVYKDPQKCIEAVTTGHRVFDLLLTDIVMPKVRGCELFRILQQLTPALKVVFMSGYTADAHDDQYVIDSEATFIQKPLGVDSLLTIVRQRLDSLQVPPTEK